MLSINMMFYKYVMTKHSFCSSNNHLLFKQCFKFITYFPSGTYFHPGNNLCGRYRRKFYPHFTDEDIQFKDVSALSSHSLNLNLGFFYFSSSIFSSVPLLLVYWKIAQHWCKITCLYKMTKLLLHYLNIHCFRVSLFKSPL